MSTKINKDMKANELIHKGLYKAGEEIVFFNAINGHLYQRNEVFYGCLFEDPENGELSVLTEPDKGSTIEPILLTEKILKANELYPILYCDLSMPNWFMSLRNNNTHVKMPFKYVHQLQHALRICELNELADTFKI